MPEKKFKYLVVDTTAFINNVSLQNYADVLVTVPDVISEIKNKRQLKRLCVLPYELTVRDPFPESVQHVSEFAKKTGDYLSLSAADIKVIALTYELEKEIVGVGHLRTTPVVSKTFTTKEVPDELLPQGPIIGFYNPESDDEEEEDEEEVKEENETDTVSNEKQTKEVPNVDAEKESNENNDDEEEIDEKLIEQFTKLQCDQESILTAVDPSTDEPSPLHANESENSDDSEEEEEDDDDESWITPSNYSQAKKMFGNEVVEEDAAEVACMSTDYAVQNVLKQINLNVASLDGRIIKQMRTYILRCFSCFKTTSIMTKVFCPKCGNKTLKRVAVSIDENGQQVIHVNLKRTIKTKGTNKSIPTFRGGKHSNNPVLFDKQPRPKQRPTRVARTKTNALDEDYIAGVSPFAIRDIDSKSAILRGKGVTSHNRK